MKIALLDSGVDTSHRAIDADRIEHIETKQYQVNHQDTLGHGTSVAFILQQQIPEATIVSYKLFDEGNVTSEKDILDVLEEIKNSEKDIRIINMSCGLTAIDDYERFYKICSELNSAGIIIVAAIDNNGRTSFPAVFDNVVGVFYDKTVTTPKEYIYCDDSEVNIIGFSGVQRLPWKSGIYKNVSGSSFVVPYISAKIYNILKNNPQLNWEGILKELKEDAQEIIGDFDAGSNKEKRKKINKKAEIKKAIIFPLSKETKALIGNSDLLSFEIVGVFDQKYSKNLRRRTSDVVFGESVINKTIQNIEELEWSGSFDTIVVGHLGTLSIMYRRDYIEWVLKQCIKYKKNCVMFDCPSERYSELINELVDCGNFFITHKNKLYDRFSSLCGNYYKIPIPTLAIVGTSPRQGKYNVQLSLRRRFLKAGYSIGQICTEPSGFLFNMDVTFSNGYDNQYKITNEEELLYINREAFKLNDRAIILIGTQSQTIPYQFGNIGFMTWHQQNTLLATEPDATLLCVNVDDDVDYIRRTISVLRDYYMTEVIALVVFPFARQREWNIDNQLNERMNDTELEGFKQVLSKTFGIPCFINGISKDMDLMYRKCISFFAGGE